MRISVDEFKKRYPNLWKELKQSEKITVKIEDPLRGYNPSIIDFIQRAENKSEALEVIDYMLRKGEISEPYADHLKKIIIQYGPRYFGPKREDGYYLKKYYNRDTSDT